MAVKVEGLLKRLFGTSNPLSIRDNLGSNNGPIVREDDAHVTAEPKKEVAPTQPKTSTDKGDSL